MSPEGHHSIGEVLALLQEEFPDVTISKIRFLEKEGLIDPERTPSGYRKFYDDDVACLRWILRQQRENYLPLKVIRQRIDSGAWQDDERPAAPVQPTLAAVDPLPAAAPEAVIEERPVRAVEALDTGMTGVSLTVEELAAATGLSGDAIAELTKYGLLAGRQVGSAVLYDDEALVVARLAAAFERHGVEARHLRMYKMSADREAGFLEQLASPMVRQRDAGARRQAFELVGELCSLGDQMRASLLRRSLRDQLGPL
ncbi:MAG TPA: MerR family transcriptional regulator [Acidimicrobiales bacterium]|jgi:DNA-binding transcriptional MerR regulator